WFWRGLARSSWRWSSPAAARDSCGCSTGASCADSARRTRSRLAGVALPPLVGELNRRRVFRALIGYGIAAFAVLQIAEPIMHGLRLPDIVLTYVVVALALGFPVVVTLAWVFDVNAGIIERTPPEPSLTGARLLLLL